MKRQNGTVVEVRNLTKHYPGIKAVDGISFDVQRGEILGEEPSWGGTQADAGQSERGLRET